MPDQSPDVAPLMHGGNLAAARILFPGAPEPFLDLSTGINPFAYPLPPLTQAMFARLPEPSAVERLQAVAATFYGAPSPAHVVAAPGTQSLLTHVMTLVRPGRTAILGPTYNEHARVAAACGHQVEEVADVSRLGAADLAVVVNPNNPDGRLLSKEALLDLAQRLNPGGLLVVDEAFMDTLGNADSLAGETAPGIVVLRSFGKFFGLAGLRLGFAVASPPIATRLRATLGPWAVSGPAIAVGTAALADHAWAEAMRRRLDAAATQLDQILREAGLIAAGGTSLFRLVRTARAPQMFYRLGVAGILVRHFPEHPGLLRFGLPGSEAECEKLREAFARMR